MTNIDKGCVFVTKGKETNLTHLLSSLMQYLHTTHTHAYMHTCTNRHKHTNRHVLTHMGEKAHDYYPYTNLSPSDTHTPAEKHESGTLGQVS